MNSCIFCKIVKMEIPCYKVYEDEQTLAFLDIQPCTEGHTVVIPKNHGATVFDLQDNDILSLMLAAKEVMEKLKEKINPDGFNVGWNHGKAGGQAVEHLHLHVLPRWNNDGGGSMHSIINTSGSRSVEEVAELFK